MANLNILLALAIITLLLVISASARLHGPDDDPRNTHFSLGTGPSPNDDDMYAISSSFHLRGPDDDPRNTHISLGTGLSPNNDDESALAREPYPRFFAFVDKCMKKLTEKCGKQISSAIFKGGNVSKKCCEELVDTGKQCHREILKATINLAFISEEIKEDFEKKDTQVWSKCVSSIAS